jgi:hypothetical protein
LLGAEEARAGLIMEGHGALLQAGDVQSCRVLSSGAKSSAAASVSSPHGLLSLLYRHGVEIDALVRIEVRLVLFRPGVAVCFCRDRRLIFVLFPLHRVRGSARGWRRRGAGT